MSRNSAVSAGNLGKERDEELKEICDQDQSLIFQSPSSLPNSVSVQFRSTASNEIVPSAIGAWDQESPHFDRMKLLNSRSNMSRLSTSPARRKLKTVAPNWCEKCSSWMPFTSTSPKLKVANCQHGHQPEEQFTPYEQHDITVSTLYNNWPKNSPQHDIAGDHLITYEKRIPDFFLQEQSLTSAKPKPDLYGSTSSVFSFQSQQSSIISTCSDRPHCRYVKGVDGVEFKRRTEKMISWFDDFNDQQRNTLLQKLLERSDCAQMHFLSLYMEPILHVGCPHNCQDLLSWLPSYIAELILGYLDPVSLCRASQVSHKWQQMASNRKLWRKLSKFEQWQLSASGEAELIRFHTFHDSSIQWKSLFAEKFRLRRNWLKGYCTVRTFEGHIQGISCIQFDDTRIVSGSWDKTIKVWNRRTNTAWAALTLAGHSGTVRCLHLHGNRLVSGSSDRTIKVWDLSTDKIGWVGAACRTTMVGHLHTVRCLQADNKKVISGSYDLTLKIWDIKTGDCTKTLRGHTDAVLCLQFAGDNVVSGSKDMSIKVWSLFTGSCKLTLYGHQGAVTCVQFDETKVISGALDTLIKIWNFHNGECIRTIDWIRSEGHTGVIRHLQADSWKIISAADDKTMKVWSVQTGDRLLTLKSHTDGVTCLQFNDKIIVSGSYDKTVKLWDFSAC